MDLLVALSELADIKKCDPKVAKAAFAAIK